jgi:micrococcal nuclease
MYEYKATVEEVIDGDTLDVEIDLGFRVTTLQRVRLVGVDTPELNSPDPAKRAAAQDAQAFVRRWVAEQNGQVLIQSQKPGGGDKYGRYLATVMPTGPVTGDTSKGYTLGAMLIAAGHATEYTGGARG